MGERDRIDYIGACLYPDAPKFMPKRVRHSDADEVFEKAAELFALMSSAVRLQIISRLCGRELSVSQLQDGIDVSQPNLSQHLSMLYRAGVLGRRKEGAMVFYRIGDLRTAAICRAICTEYAIAADKP